MDIQDIWVIFDKFGLYIWSSLAVVFIIIMVFSIYRSHQAKSYKKQLARIQYIVSRAQPSKSLEKNLDDFLELYSNFVEAASYAFYIFENKNKSYMLRAVRYLSGDFGKVRPSYSGLTAFKKEEYMPPLTLPASSEAPKIDIVSEGEVPLLIIPIGDKGFVRIGPIFKVAKSTRSILQELSETVRHIVSHLIETENIRSQSEVVVSSGKALQKISHIALDSKVTIDFMIHLCAQMIGATGGCYVEHRGNNSQIPVTVGMDTETKELFLRDTETIQYIQSLVKENPIYHMKRGEQEFYRVPPYFSAMGIEGLSIISVNKDQSFFMFWYDKIEQELENGFIDDMLKTIIFDMRSIVGLQSSMVQMSDTYFNILKVLAKLIDNLSPYTVGYSELMSRYAVIIAREMGLEEDVIRDVAMAAYLSNIGVLGISSDLLSKEGKFTDQEFEMMKLHAEVGASIVKMTTGNERIASYIMHHHERMDGNGYPSNLKGEDIPVGARIIAVLQTFLAKINGRLDREPLKFNQALQTMKAASGTQLDPDVVNIFLNWYQLKRHGAGLVNRSLGSCWEMCCTPASICESCPAYGRTDINCWEVEGNHCQAHGKKCETCFVRTEVTSRLDA